MGTTYRISTGNRAEVRHVTPYTEPVLHKAGSALPRVSRQPCETKNIFQRALLHISDWVKSRVAAAKIRSAMTPFIEHATKTGAPMPTTSHCNALGDAIRSAFAMHHGAEEAVAQAVRRSMEGMDRNEKIGLRSELNKTGLGERVRDSLLQAVNHSIAQSIANDADYLALQALKNITSSFAIQMNVAYAFICEHLKVVRPTGDSVFEQESSFSPVRQMACISPSKDSAVLTWFAAQSAFGQRKIIDALDQAANRAVFDGSSAGLKKERIRAFSIRMKEVLSGAVTA